MLLLVLAVSPIVMRAQTPTIVGFPANFDAYNNTGAPVYGFEIEADGINSGDITRIFGGVWQAGQPCVIRYCQGTATDFPGGVYIRWESPWDPTTQQFTLSTPLPTAGIIGAGESCWTLGLGARYPTAGCEHFGISTARAATRIVYSWLVPDPNNAGHLVPYSGNTVPLANAPPAPPIQVPIPQPIVNVIPPAQPGGAPVVAFEIQAAPPPPPPAPKPVPQYGDAQWVKVYKTELDREVDLNELMGGNPVVPEDPAAIETQWKLLQYNPNSHGNSGILHNQQQLGNGKHAVVRRYEHYQYTGTYDPLDHHATCLDGTCSVPGNGELGDIIGAQNAAANIEIPSLTVAKVGSGTVTGANGKINCGGTCTVTEDAGTVVSLTAAPPSNAVFNGWSEACAGNQPTCTVTVDGGVNTTATFTTVFTLSIGRGGSGTVTGTPGGEFGTFIACGSSCSAKFQQGRTVTLTATPPPGHVFVNWTGSCSGTLPSCDVTITKDTQVQANFK
jgi:uncharacterized repeat protein (TIGR02543 family)